MPTAVIPAICPADKWFVSDEQFDLLYPGEMRSLANSHWTPLEVTRKAATFLAAEKNTRILDIGSGIGKFCLAAAHYMPLAFYTGVEQREELAKHAENAKKVLGIKNAAFIHANFTEVDFKNYDHFYFYNSFYENVAFTNKIDNNIEYSGVQYHQYARYLLKQLEQKPAGTRLATFHSLEDEIPEDYMVVGTDMDNDLKCWIKI